MASGEAPLPQGTGGRKTVDFQLNLVPFIDLLSVLISFLLMTSVWTQVARINVRQEPNDESGGLTPPPTVDRPKLTVLIRASGYTVSRRGVIVKEIEKNGDKYNSAALNETLKQVVSDDPDNREVTVTSEDQVPYGELITVMDMCLEHKLEGISVAGAGA